MLWTKYSYKWYSLEQIYNWVYDSFNDSKHLNESEILFLEDVEDDAKVRIDVVNNSNRHGWFIWPWIIEPRLITMKWKIFAPSDENWLPQLWRLEKKIEELKRNLSVESNPMNNWYHELRWWTRYNEQRVTMAKVRTMPIIRHSGVNPYVDFTLELVCWDPFYYHPTVRTAVWTNTVMWWSYLPHVLPYSWDTSAWSSIQVDNKWNAIALCSINVQWNGENVTIFNTTNWYKTRVSWSITNLTVETVQTQSLELQVIVRENTTNLRPRIAYWAWIVLDPWVNEIVILSDNTDILVATVTWRDTYI